MCRYYPLEVIKQNSNIATRSYAQTLIAWTLILYDKNYEIKEIMQYTFKPKNT